ncbi:hypothetical protein ABB37_07898 [Leptomonas pyrrhocoris]|uniref:Uncharacterized protein n=1 Tax=Leptomonas pyrrhocoris TaxID=157538 RepID=A0A0N0DSV4_LEPPY|nr:hypothetical protein ABB37_07898 [Leptomonas pyrrhocoris]XP_015654570.1 hypothetical protein ABB37_07898 [Leptomonas pyrrhocoris]KPA76130.1 hypothetical protein ABB37_07898 [Leptomonas pyrrhocoris]KPA76131.1 hypothetical protein ABB37_07898 [Leptomonas pyrrhocoris]|eukprot:XP_015654569.1 hypothetical protein ABB37_07898 [Leptomonas pyrrhocoris]
MDRSAQFGSGSSLHRDEGESQSLSQARPRPAIRLDASLSFLHAGSRAGSPRSGPASPALGPAHASAMFATRDVNTESSYPGPHGALKSRSGYRREISSSLQATSASLSLGSSRPRSHHRHPPQQPQQAGLGGRATEAAGDELGSHKEARGLSSLAVMDAVLDSEATVMTRPSEPRMNGGGDPVEEDQESWQPQRTASPAPRMAVTLPDDFDGDFSESHSAAVAVAAGFPVTEAGIQSTTLPHGAEATAVMPGRSVNFSNASSFSFHLKASSGEPAEDNGNEEEGVSCRSRSSRGWSTTPPPRRAFVLSQRCSAASTVAAGDDDDNDERPVTDHHAAGAEEEKPQDVPAQAVHNVDDVAAPIPTGDATVTAVRGSAVLVMDSNDDSQRFFGQLRREERERRDRRHRRQQLHSEEEKSQEEGGEGADGVVREEERDGTAPTLPVGRLAPGQVVEEGGEDTKSGAAVGTQAQNESEVGCEDINSPQHENGTEDVPSFAARESAGLRLSDCVSGSSRSSMLSPLPRPVASVAQTVAAGGAVRQPPRISPAHQREEEDEERVGAEGEKKEEGPQSDAAVRAVYAEGGENEPKGRDVNFIEGAVVAEDAAAPDQLDRADNDEDEGEKGVAALDSIFEEHAEPSVSTTRTTANTAMSAAAVSSLWLVRGPTPTPLRQRRRGDCDESPERETDKAAAADEAKLSASPTVETEQAEAEAVTQNTDEDEMATTALPITLKDATSPPRSAALSVTSEEEEVEEEDTASKKPKERNTNEVPHAPSQRTVASPPLPPHAFRDDDSCSPEPQRPVALQQEEEVTVAATTRWKAALSPVSSPDRRHHHPAVEGVRTEQEAAPTSFTSSHAKADPLPAKTRKELDLLRPSPSTSATHSSVVGSGVTPDRQKNARTHITTTTTVTSVPSSPSTTLSESARVSEEVRELVERAQAEVRRTRASLLATMRDHRADFHLTDVAPASPPAESAGPSPPTTPTRSLVLPPVASTSVATAHGRTDAPSTTPSAAAAALIANTTPSTTGQTGRASEQLRTAAVTLRPQLAEAADAILRRLQGYDTRQHGVLPMETVMRVAYFVVVRRGMPVATWTLRTVGGGIASTPMRASMVMQSKEEADMPSARRYATGSAAAAGTEGRRAALLATTPLGRSLRGVRSEVHRAIATYSTPHNQLLSEAEGLTCAAKTPSLLAGSSVGVKRTRSEEESETEAPGRPATLMSPSRTLEQVMARQERRAEEERSLNFYFTVLEAFKQVFGERYAWHHLGATNASRHDSAAVKRSRADQSIAATATEKQSKDNGSGDVVEAEKDGEDAAAGFDIENELNDIAAPLETVFPRLRQQYALHQRDGTATPGMGFAQRPPPLDVLVYYRTFTDSLREL